MQTHPTTTLDSLLNQIREQQTIINRLRWDAGFNMLNPAGLCECIRTLPTDTTYTVVFADVDHMKHINTATQSHFRTDRLLASGFRVRNGEIAGRIHGDEIIFILAERSDHGRREAYSANAFVARITRQLAGQPLTVSERYALAAAQGCPVEQARLSATFSAMSSVRAQDIEQAIEWLSSDVLRLKAARDSKVTI